MSSSDAVRRGVQVPQIVHQPRDVHSLAGAEEAIELADNYGLCDGHPLSESQRFRLRNALGERADGSWSATTVADFGPRQGSGKSDTINARELAGLVLFGERLIIHTAHEFPTANESFLRLVAVFDAWDDLRKLVARIRYGNGSQAIEFLSGQRVVYKARTAGGVRGFAKADLTVYDEAQHIKAEHVAASGPAKLANPNAQSWYAGSGGLEASKQAWQLRKMALRGEGARLAYTEHTAEDVWVSETGTVKSVRPENVMSRDVWVGAIPGYGIWVTDESLEALHLELGGDDELFAREALCVWDTEPGEEVGVIDLDEWSTLADAAKDDYPGSQIVDRHCFALDVAADRSWAAFGVAGRRSDGLLHVEVVETAKRTGWVVDVGKALFEEWGLPIRVQKGSPAASFTDELRDAGVDVLEVSVGEFGEAVGRFLDAVENKTLRHTRQGSLFGALKGAVLRSSGDASVWARRTSKADISPLVAVTLALGGVAVPVEEVQDAWAFAG
jgi:hypothetical protein